MAKGGTTKGRSAIRLKASQTKTLTAEGAVPDMRRLRYYVAVKMAVKPLPTVPGIEMKFFRMWCARADSNSRPSGS